MAYQLTSATSVEDLVNKIVGFATTAGWTVLRNDLAAGLRTATLKKTGDYINIWNATTTDLRVRGAVGFSAGVAPDLQPNVAASSALCNVGAGPFSSVFLFADNLPSEYLHCVVEVTSGVFRHITFGELRKIGSYVGGTFFDALYLSSVSVDDILDNRHHILFSGRSDGASWRGGVRCDLDGNVNYFCPFEIQTMFTTPVANGLGPLAVVNTGDGNRERFIESFYNRSINTWSGVTPLKPIKIRAERGSSFWSEIGEVPGIRSINMARFQAGDEVTIGSDVWKIFPWIKQGNVSLLPDSEDYAFAYLKTI